MDVHDEERSGRPSVITDDLMQAVETKICENRRFVINILSLEFPDVSRSLVYKIMTEDLNFKKLCSWWVSRLFSPEHKEKRFANPLDFLIRYEEEGDSMLSRIITGEKNMGIPYHSGIKSTVDGIATHIISRQVQSQTNNAKTGNSAAIILHFWN
ncbi:histone-lysine N-methyltransferase SETMAR [Trichonephila clavipes]|nr:histone-lysine N-methyltransferase SETMAR [Trichonephila clavipes]